MKKTVVFDFDGVIHSYTSGWKGATIIPDPPVEGIEQALIDIRNAGYEIAIVSTRSALPSGRIAVINWLDKWNLLEYVDRVCTEKPPAIVYIDDRAIRFDGKPENLLEQINTFKPWYETGEKNE